MAGGEWGQQKGFAGGPLGYPGGKSEQDARHFGPATSPELLPGCWIQALTYTPEDVRRGDCSLFVVIWGMNKSQQT